MLSVTASAWVFQCIWDKIAAKKHKECKLFQFRPKPHTLIPVHPYKPAFAFRILCHKKVYTTMPIERVEPEAKSVMVTVFLGQSGHGFVINQGVLNETVRLPATTHLSTVKAVLV